ncbi:MAG: YkuS family protein [Oscillospiraceae bacterium]|nr:YkuS family protein [Oscillospiraceae bacterium]
MVVAFEKGLDDIREKIDKMGFNTVVYGEYIGSVDALVYSRNIDISAISNAATEYGGYGENDSFGILLVNCCGKSAEETAAILRSGIYSALF